MSDQDFVLAPATETVSVHIALEPAFSVLNSLMLLSHPEERSGFSSWVSQTAAKMSPELSRRHQLIFNMLYHGIEPMESWPSFPAYVDHLATVDAETVRDRAVQWMCKKELEGIAPLEKDTLLNDREAYIQYLEQIYTQKWEKEVPFDPSFYEEAHSLLQNAQELKILFVDHLRQMWDAIMKQEWERTQFMLQESVDAFQQLDYGHITALEAIRIVTGRDFRGIHDEWGKELIFIPSPHIGPYVTWFDDTVHNRTRIVFGARLPEGARVNSPALSRSELLVRLSALADDTRLQVLELLTQHDELCAQDVIEMLDLSQSAASRHLRQLTATGYLVERRREVAKCYSLNPQRVDDTLRALKRFLRAK